MAKRIRRKWRIIILNTFIDIALLCLSFLIMTQIKPSDTKTLFHSHSLFLISLIIIWIIMSLLYRKYRKCGKVRYFSFISDVGVCNFISLAIVIVIMFAFQKLSYSRLVVFGTFLWATFFEILLATIYYSLRKTNLQGSLEEDFFRMRKGPSEYDLVSSSSHDDIGSAVDSAQVDPRVRTLLEEKMGFEITEELISIIGSRLTERIIVHSTSNPFNITSLPENQYHYIINLRNLNKIRDIDGFFDAVNGKLEAGGYLLCYLETKNQRKEKLLAKYPPVINYIIYFFDFIYNRIMPKTVITKPIYNLFSRNGNKVISRAEALGRVSRAGFKILHEGFHGNYLFIEGQKIKEPLPRKSNYDGLLIMLERIGRNGKTIKVYKLRTMHPYSEYIQEYVYRNNNILKGGKFKNDFRVTSWGHFCRQIWLDELPMIINLFKGDLKLVGVRPLSKQYFSLYDKDVQERRIKYKPGLIPPFYVDMPKGLVEIQESEIKYLDEYDKHPFLTDCRYLFKSAWNIVFKRARSK